MTKITAIYGSPRRSGNSSVLLKHAVIGAESVGAVVDEIVLRDQRISPCLEIYACKKAGECAIRDDFAAVRDRMLGRLTVHTMGHVRFASRPLQRAETLNRNVNCLSSKLPAGSRCARRHDAPAARAL